MDAVKLAPGESRKVEIPDPKTDASRVYAVRPLTRSLKRKLREMEAETDKLREDLPENLGGLSEEQEDALMRAACDMLNEVLEPTKGTVQAGDHLFDWWAKDQFTDEQIYDLVTKLVYGAQDPT